MPQDRNLLGCQVFKKEDLPPEWDCAPLKERIELAYGRGLREEDRRPGNIDVYGSNGPVGKHDIALVNEPGVLVGRKGTVGAVHFAENPFWPIDTVYYVVPTAGDNIRYLHHLLDYLPLGFLNAATGVPGLSRRDAYALRGAFPLPDEQSEIARVLDSVDTALQRTHAAVRQVRELKRAILQRFFYGALGETAYADRPRKTLPEGWVLVPTEKLLLEEPKNGVSPEASSQPPGIPTFSIAAIRDGRVDLKNKEHLKYTRAPEKIIQRYGLRRGDVLIVRGNANPDLVGNAGMVSWVPEGCIYPDIAKRVVFRTEGEPKVSAEFAVLVWNHPVVHNQVLRRAKTSNGTLKINNRDVNQIMLPVPPEAEQKSLVQLTAAVDEQMDRLRVVESAQYRLKRSLMHDLLRGRVHMKAEAGPVAS